MSGNACYRTVKRDQRDHSFYKGYVLFYEAEYAWDFSRIAQIGKNGLRKDPLRLE